MASIVAVTTVMEHEFNWNFLMSDTFFWLLASALAAFLIWFFRMRLTAHPKLYERMAITSYIPGNDAIVPTQPPGIAGLLYTPYGDKNNVLLATAVDLCARGILCIQSTKKERWYQTTKITYTAGHEKPKEPYEQFVLEMLLAADIRSNSSVSKLFLRTAKMMKHLKVLFENKLFQDGLIEPMRYKNNIHTSYYAILTMVLGLCFLPISIPLTATYGLSGLVAIAAVATIIGIVALILSARYDAYTPKGYEEYKKCKVYAGYVDHVLKTGEIADGTYIIPYAIAFSYEYKLVKYLKQLRESGVQTVFANNTSITALIALAEGLQAQKSSD